MYCCILKELNINAIMIWLILFVFFWCVFGNLFSLPDKKEVQFLVNFRINKESHIKRFSLLGLAGSSIVVFFSLIILSLIENVPVIPTALSGCSAFILISLIWKRIDLTLTLQRRPWIKKVLVLIVVFGLSLAILMSGLASVLNQMFSSSLYLIVFWGINVALSFLLLKSYWNYNRFIEVANKKVRTSLSSFEVDDTSEKVKKTYYFNEGSGLTKSMVVEHDDSLEGLSGSYYLNALFFSRFRKGLKKNVLIKILAICAAGVIVVGSRLIIPWITNIGELEKFMYRLVPSLFFILYLTSVGKGVVQSLFMNCDISMLSFPFYRTKDAILYGFIARFKKILYYNSLVNATVLFWLVTFNLIVGGINSLHLVGLALLVMISLTLLFSFHELFIYYLLQPFTSDFQVVNPIYKVVNGLFYLFAYMNLQLKTTGLYYALGISVVSLVYVGIGFIVILRVAPKTFQLKK